MSTSPDFESIKQINILGQYYWSARDLMPLLGYEYWQNFEKVIEKAKVSAQEVGLTVQDHFSDITKMIKIGKGAKREIKDYFLRAASIRKLVEEKRRKTRKKLKNVPPDEQGTLF